MKLLKIFILATAFFCANLVSAEEQESQPQVTPLRVEEATQQGTPIKEIKTDKLNFDQLSEKFKVGCLAEHVKDKSLSLDSFLQAIKLHKTYILQPHAEGMAYVNGELCHVGNYPQSVIYTVLEGPHYGLQTTTAYNGIILYVNYDYLLEYTPYGTVLHHFYSDSEVITGANQLISFY